MSTDAYAHLHAGLERGLRLDELQAALQELIARVGSQPTLPPPSLDIHHTTPALNAPSVPDLHQTVPPTNSTDPVALSRPIEGLPRYEDLGPLGMGGMGEVRRVYDRRLGRQLALKTLRARIQSRPSLVARFLDEAQATAQLQHPGIVPIYDMGELPDGRLWFTMKEISGETFDTVITEVHAVSREHWRASPSGWSLRRLIDTLRQVCEAVGYAHSRGVVHRDLKPANVMVGSHGEVLVLDWGLAKVYGQADETWKPGELGPVQTDRSREGAHRTLVGQIAGTPAYMSPEQARGQVRKVDARSDVYALGAMLYHVLSGRTPYTGDGVTAVLEKVRSGPPAPLSGPDHTVNNLATEAQQLPSLPGLSSPTPPQSLVAACEKAMARVPEDRFESATELATELQAWLEGARRRADARAVVARASDKQPEATRLRTRASNLRAQAAELLRDVEPWRPETDKLPGWQKEDEAYILEKRAELLELEKEQLLEGSLTHAPDLPAAHAALAAHYRAAHEAAETTRQDTTRTETLFRQHLNALPPDHPKRIHHLTYLKGDGALTLVTDPPGAEVLLHRYVVHNRRLVPRFERSLGTTPLHAVPLPMGSYLCILKHPERAEVRYPVAIRRGEHWHGVPPEGGDPHPIALPQPDELGTDDCYIPAGWFQCGGDPGQERSLSARRVWVDGWVFRRFPVTNTEYIAFLDTLVATGRTEDALRHAPRERGGTVGQQGALVYGFEQGRFILRPDADGDQWQPDWPVTLVDWYGAMACATQEAVQTGLPWQLPSELAWEKATRGVDGRYFPWGDGFDPSWACMRLSHRGRMTPKPVGAFPTDESPYGVRDLGGSMAAWCADAFHPDGPPAESARAEWLRAHRAQSITEAATAPGLPGTVPRRAYRGGAWAFRASAGRATNRIGGDPIGRDSFCGVRLARLFRPG